MDGNAAQLVRRNEEAFRRHQPRVWAFLQGLTSHTRLVVDEAGVPVNISVEGTNLYPEAAPTWTAAQLDGYFADPDRLVFSDVSYCNLSPVSHALRRELADYLADHDLGLSRQPLQDVGFAFVFGVGLGHHLTAIVERTDCRRLVIYEPVPEFLLHSLAVVDWAALFAKAEAGDLHLLFMFDPNPAGAISAVEGLLSKVGSTFLDGSYAYVHYYSWQLRQARALLNEKIRVFYLSTGFFEDELLMSRNTYLNQRRWPFRLVSRRPMREQATPVFIVGSGPSLDADLPHLKRLRDHAIVVSCGTSLGILLKHGIRPEFHVENENTEPLVHNLRLFAAEYGLHGVRLLASTTVHPDIGGLFDERFLYFRSHLSSAQILAADAEPITGAAPMVANAAMATMRAMGFDTFYLFGVDCGRPHDGSHHAADAVYHRDDYDNYAPGESYEMLESGFEREVPGNFGGTALTTWYLDMSRAAFAAFIAARGVTVFNCGRGARIDNAQPKAAASVVLNDPPNRQSAILADVQAQLQAFDAGRYLDKLDLPGLVAGADAFTAAWATLVAEMAAGDCGFWDLERRLMQFHDSHFEAHKAVFALASSSMRSMIRLGAFGGTRITDETARRRYFTFFLERYDRAVRAMAGRVRAMAAEMAEGRDDLTEKGGMPVPGG